MVFDNINDYLEKFKKIIIIILLIFFVAISTIALNFVQYLDYIDALTCITAIWFFIALILASDIIDVNKLIKTTLVREIKDIKSLIIEPNCKVYKYQSDANKDLIKYIEDEKPQCVKMIEYSSRHVNDLISTLIMSRTNPNIYLLIQHPNVAESIKGQKERIISHLKTVIALEREFKSFANLKILFYEQRASLRGRNFGNKIINIGWYLYELDGKEMRVNGHKKPSFILNDNYEGFSIIQKMFNDNFENLWTNGISLKEAILECYESSSYDNEFIEWCENVSPEIGERKIEI